MTTSAWKGAPPGHPTTASVIARNSAKRLYVGDQVINTTRRETPADLASAPHDAAADTTESAVTIRGELALPPDVEVLSLTPSPLGMTVTASRRAPP